MLVGIYLMYATGRGTMGCTIFYEWGFWVWLGGRQEQEEPEDGGL